MRATRRAPAGGGARDGDDVVPEPFAPSRPSLLYLFNCRIGAPMDGSCLRWCVLHALLLMSPGDRAQLPGHVQVFLNQVLACSCRSAQMRMLCRLCIPGWFLFGNDHELDLWALVGSDEPFWRFRPMAPFGPDSAATPSPAAAAPEPPRSPSALPVPPALLAH